MHSAAAHKIKEEKDADPFFNCLIRGAAPGVANCVGDAFGQARRDEGSGAWFIGNMGPKPLREAPGDLLHRSLGAFETIYRERKVEGFLDLPDSFMFIWRQNPGRVAHGYPAYGHRFTCSQHGPKVYNPIDAHFAALPQTSGMKDGRASGDENFVFHRATHHVCVGADQAVVADTQRMPGGTPEDGILHDDALAADVDGPALGDDLCSIHDATARANSDVAADDGIRCDPCSGIHLGRDAVVLYEHLVFPHMHKPGNFWAEEFIDGQPWCDLTLKLRPDAQAQPP